MVEIFLVLSNLLFGISILGYFYFKEIKNLNKEFDRMEQVDSFYSSNSERLASTLLEEIEVIKSITKSKDDLFQKTLLEYLKHNERLEKMILPQPVTRKAVQDILNQTPQMVPNDIDKVEEEIKQDELNEMLNKIPISKDTKIAFEGDDGLDNGLAEEIDGGVISGRIN